MKTNILFRRNPFFIDGKLKSLLALVIFFMFITATLKSENPAENSIAGASDYVPVGKHPYLFYTSDRIKRLQYSIKQDTLVQREWKNLIDRVDKSLTQEGNSGSIDDLGLVYIMTRDKKYAAKIKQILFASCKRENWESIGLLSRTPPWNAGLNLSKTCYSVGVGYDCIYDYLTPEERKTIVEGLVRLGILPTMNDWVLGGKRIHSFDSMGHN